MCIRDRVSNWSSSSAESVSVTGWASVLPKTPKHSAPKRCSYESSTGTWDVGEPPPALSFPARSSRLRRTPLRMSWSRLSRASEPPARRSRTGAGAAAWSRGYPVIFEGPR
eukprot:7245165-Pyramimonas_sp.AAC.1